MSEGSWSLVIDGVLKGQETASWAKRGLFFAMPRNSNEAKIAALNGIPEAALVNPRLEVMRLVARLPSDDFYSQKKSVNF